MKGRLIRHAGGAAAAEFALVLPLFLFLFLGTIDVGRWIWTYNRAEKATQMGARLAVVTDYVEPGLAASYVGTGTLQQGDVIPASQFGMISCTSAAACTCTTSPCPTLGTKNAVAFDRVVTRMRAFMPTIAASNVTIQYSSSGLGYVGNPSGPDLAPLVTVRLQNLPFRPTLCVFFGCLMRMPDLHTSLTFEDGKGIQSN